MQINQQTLELTSDPAYIVSQDGMIVYANPAARAATGYAGQRLTAMSFWDIDSEMTAANWPERWRDMIGGALAHYESRHQRDDGKSFPVAVSVTALTAADADYLCVRARDITLIRERARQMEQLQFAVANATDAVFLTRPNGEIFYVNQSACDQLGYTRDELAGMNISDINPAMSPEIRALAGESGEAGIPRTLEAVHQRKDGTVFPVELTFKLADFDGERYAVTFARNIMERKKFEEELRSNRERLEQQVEERTLDLRAAQEELLERERLAVLGRLTGVVGHELRNPLGTIRSSLYVLRNNIHEKSDLVIRALNRAERNIIRCDRIIEELLDYTRARPAILEAVSIDAWLAEIIEDYDFPPAIKVDTRYGADRRLRIEPERLRRCIVNVLANACEALRDSEPDKPPVIRVATRVGRGEVEIEIADNGPGIPVELQDKVFEPLFSTKGFGIGLGLAIVEQIMEQHHGSVEIRSNKGVGTSVLLCLPI
jgi:PAS domain S-box-containing protein